MIPSNETCPVAGCNELTPWDMLAVNFDGQYFCSPECARQHLKGMERDPDSMTLHDPQYTVDRSQLYGVGQDDVDITRATNGRDDADAAISEIEDMVPCEFRVPEPSV